MNHETSGAWESASEVNNEQCRQAFADARSAAYDGNPEEGIFKQVID